MDVIEILGRIKQGETVKDIAQSIGTNTKNIHRQLKREGYQFNQKSKEWTLTGNAEQEAAATTEPTDVLTADEVRQIRSLLSRSKPQTQKPTNGIHERIKSLEKAERSRKTVIIRDDITDRLDALVKRERIFKSDALELAILDFLEKYE